MRRFLVGLVTVALALPATAALASDDLGVSASPCPYPQKGVIVRHTDPKTGDTYIWACV